MGIDPDAFGTERHPGDDLLRWEDEIMILFGAYVVHCPRNGQEHNSGTYAEQAISHARTWMW